MYSSNCCFLICIQISQEAGQGVEICIQVRWWKSVYKSGGGHLHTDFSGGRSGHGIWFHYFMTNRWGNIGNSENIFLGSKITVDGDCSHEIKRCLLLGRKAMTNLDSILKSRDITLPTNVHLVKAMVFPGVMYGCESWTIKKAEHQKIDAFELWCWRRLLRVPWTARRSNQSILKEISPEYSLEGLMLKLKMKLQYFGHVMQRPWCWERLKAGGEGDDRGWDG